MIHKLKKSFILGLSRFWQGHTTEIALLKTKDLSGHGISYMIQKTQFSIQN